MHTHRPTPQQQQAARAFWKSYFAQFRRTVQDHEESQTRPAPLFASDAMQPQRQARHGSGELLRTASRQA